MTADTGIILAAVIIALSVILHAFITTIAGARDAALDVATTAAAQTIGPQVLPAGPIAVDAPTCTTEKIVGSWVHPDGSTIRINANPLLRDTGWKPQSRKSKKRRRKNAR